MNGGLYVTFEIKNRDKLAYLTIPAFERTGLVKHGFSTRLGGISKAPYDTLNLGFKKRMTEIMSLKTIGFSVKLYYQYQ